MEAKKANKFKEEVEDHQAAAAPLQVGFQTSCPNRRLFNE